MLLGTSCAGRRNCGFMFSREILEKVRGWEFYFLTEEY
jgi:hypothetical protein